MQVLDKETKFAHLGKPGDSFSPGFARRLNLVAEKVDLKDKKILDIGCGKGVWLSQFRKYTAAENIFGSDIDPELIEQIPAEVASPDNLVVSPAEKLPFDDNSFDVIFHNEVLEHVEDDQQMMNECLRVLKPEGKMVFFTPNRGWPFEQHGIFLNKKYIWGNIPLLPWLPKGFYNKFAPHVRNYWDKDIRKLVEKAGGKIIFHKHVFPAFDGMTRRFGPVGRLLQWKFHFLEKTLFHKFGLSHFVVVVKA